MHPGTESTRSCACSRGLNAAELGHAETIMGLRGESQNRGRSAVSRAQRRRMHRGGCTRTSSRLMSGHAIGPRYLYMHPGCWLHAPGRLSAERALKSVIDISLQKPRAERSIQPPRGGEVVVHRRDDVDLGCRTAPRTHSNTVKQKKLMRGWLWAADRLAQLMCSCRANPSSRRRGTGSSCSSQS